MSLSHLNLEKALFTHLTIPHQGIFQASQRSEARQEDASRPVSLLRRNEVEEPRHREARKGKRKENIYNVT